MAARTATTPTSRSVTSPVRSNDTTRMQINIHGTEQDDVLYGNGADNFMYGLGGNDVFMGSAGRDELHGSNGVDTVNYSDSSGWVSVDLITGIGGGNGDARGDRLVDIENVTGSSYDDHLYGDHEQNVLSGLAGDDELHGRAGDDTLIGGKGNDVLNGGIGADVLDGGSGIDTASYADATSGVDLDLAGGWAGSGEAHNDIYISIENLIGTAFDDILRGNDLANVIEGGVGNDVLYGRDGNDTLIGGSNDDVLIGGAGADHLIGGSGRDKVEYTDSNVGVTIRLDGTSSGGTASGDTYEGVEDARGSHHNDTFYGTSADNHLIGGSGNDTFHGDAGSDTLEGGSGNDVFFGGAGADTLIGGAGEDTVSYEESSEAVIVDLGLGTGEGVGSDAQGDILQSIENLKGSKADDNVLSGSNQANEIVSYGEGDITDGKDGDDLIEVRGLWDEVKGGAGNDVIKIFDAEGLGIWDDYITNSRGAHGGPGTIIINGGDDVDTVEFHQGNWVHYGTSTPYDVLGVSVSLDGYGGPAFTFFGTHHQPNTTHGEDHVTKGFIFNVENIVGTQYSDEIGGDEADNVLWGKAGDDWLNGGAGEDLLFGGAGNDEIWGGFGNDADVIVGGQGADQINGQAGIDTASYEGSSQGVEVSLNAATATGGDAEGDTLTNIENLLGSSHDDMLEGDLGNNILDGGAGSDILDGAGGNDTLIGGAGMDQFAFGSEFHFTESHTTIADFEDGMDLINLSHLSGIDTIDDVEARLSQDGDDVVFAYEDSTITILDVSLSQLSDWDFVV